MTDGINTGADPIPMIEARTTNNPKSARIFTYSFGSEATDDTVKRAACVSGGVFQQTKDGGNLKKAMASYFSYVHGNMHPPFPLSVHLSIHPSIVCTATATGHSPAFDLHT